VREHSILDGDQRTPILQRLAVSANKPGSLQASRALANLGAPLQPRPGDSSSSSSSSEGGGGSDDD